MEIYISPKNFLHYEDKDNTVLADGFYSDDEKMISLKDGYRHRVEKPAIIYNNGTKEWWRNNKRHRLDGPALVYKADTTNYHIIQDNYNEWWLDGKRHREDGPAIEYTNGNKEWWLDGKRHRLDGPALDYGHKKEWYLEGKLIYRYKMNDKEYFNSYSIDSIPTQLKMSIIKYDLLKSI
jgi:hypothetical protein